MFSTQYTRNHQKKRSAPGDFCDDETVESEGGHETLAVSHYETELVQYKAALINVPSKNWTTLKCGLVEETNKNSPLVKT